MGWPISDEKSLNWTAKVIRYKWVARTPHDVLGLGFVQIQSTVFSLDRIGTYFSEKFMTTRSSGISSVPTRQIMPTRSTAVPTRSATA